MQESSSKEVSWFVNYPSLKMESSERIKRFQENGKPGASSARLYALALEISEDAGLSKGFMGSPLSVPFVGHGLGLELDECPVIGKNSDPVLQDGMVIAFEPKVVLPGEGVVGIENTLLITERGMEKLSRFPDDIVVI